MDYTVYTSHEEICSIIQIAAVNVPGITHCYTASNPPLEPPNPPLKLSFVGDVTPNEPLPAPLIQIHGLFQQIT